MDEPAFSGCLVPTRLIGVIEAEQSESGMTARNVQSVAMLDSPGNPAAGSSLKELGRQQLDEIEHFFVAYNEAEVWAVMPLARRWPEKAKALIAAAVVDPAPTHAPVRKPRKRSKK